MRPRPSKPFLPSNKREWRLGVPFSLNVSLRSVDGKHHTVGTAVDLSRGGMRVCASRQSIPAEVELEIILSLFEDSQLNLAGWVANIQGCSIGVQFDEQCPNTTKIIATLLTECEVFGACQGEVD